MSLPAAYFLTWTCRGSWLHGDPRGSVDADHNRPGTPWLAPDEHRWRCDARRIRRATVSLNAQARKVVRSAIKDHAAIRGWSLFALNVRSNHVHVVVGSVDGASPERVMEQFKAWSTRRLREVNIIAPEVKPWTEHGSTRWLNDADAVAAAVEYVTNRQ